MRVNVKIDMNPVGEAEKNLGLDKQGDVQKYVTQKAREYMDKHVPKDTGKLKDEATEETDKVVYDKIYARYQYYGKVMKGEKPKKVTEKDLEYQESPQRGAFWDKKMISSSGEEFFKDINSYIKNRK